MDIVITGGQGVGKTSAAHKLIAAHFGVKSIYDVTLRQLFVVTQLNIQRVDVLRETIRAARIEAVYFDECLTSAKDFLIAIQAVKEAREQIGRNLYVVYVRQTVGALEVKEYPENINLKEYVGTIELSSDRASMEYLPDAAATHKRYPLTWDNKKQAFEAANLEADGQVICSAVNVYAFEGSLKDGDGKRSKRFMLFELAEINERSGLHVAVDKMNTHYFETGRFERRAFNAKNVRTATASEVLEYLNAKYQYQLKNA